MRGAPIKNINSATQLVNRVSLMTTIRFIQCQKKSKTIRFNNIKLDTQDSGCTFIESKLDYSVRNSSVTRVQSTKLNDTKKKRIAENT